MQAVRVPVGTGQEVIAQWKLSVVGCHPTPGPSPSVGRENASIQGASPALTRPIRAPCAACRGAYRPDAKTSRSLTR